MEKLEGDLLLGQKCVKLEILSTSFLYFFHDKLAELKVKILRVNEPTRDLLVGRLILSSPQLSAIQCQYLMCRSSSVTWGWLAGSLLLRLSAPEVEVAATC